MPTPNLSRRAVLGAGGAVALSAVASTYLPASAKPPVGVKPPRALTCADVAMSGPQQARWLTLPHSRLVLNPYNFDSSASEFAQNAGPTLPLAGGYYAHDQALVDRELLATYYRPAGSPPEPEPVETLWHEPFDTVDGWITDPTGTMRAVDGRAVITNAVDATNAASANIKKIQNINLDANPTMTIRVSKADSKWSLKLRITGTRQIIALQMDNNGVGEFSFDIRSITGWSGTQNLDVILYVIGRGPELIVDDLATQTGGTTGGFVDEFDDPIGAWVAENGVSATTADGKLTVVTTTASPAPWGNIRRQVSVDFDNSPTLSITVTRAVSQWALKVNWGTEVDFSIQPDTQQTGTFSYDLSALTGLTGRHVISVILFSIGYDQPLVVESIAVDDPSWLRPAKTWETSWRPDHLPFSATYLTGSATGHDQFVDEDSAVRILKTDLVKRGQGGLVLTGRFSATPTIDTSSGTISVTLQHHSYAISLGRGHTFSFFSSQTDLLNEYDPQSTPGETGYWMARLVGRTTAVGIGYARAGEDRNAAAKRAKRASNVNLAHARRRQTEREWNRYFEAVPRPLDYSYSAVPDRGITVEQTRAHYYRAFHFMSSTVLPLMPEVGFRYPQLATGKPSMWNHGAPGAKASASWDNLFGIQFLAYIDPDTAWDAYNGLMTLVADDGMLAGESLPSRKAQTAWILYQLTGSRRKLGEQYENLKRYLAWAEANPRWIFLEHDYPDERDADFVVSLIVDLGYAAQIAEALGRRADAEDFRLRAALLQERWGEWFFRDGEAIQYHYVEGSRPDFEGNGLWVATGLVLPGITPEQKSALMARFHEWWDPAGPVGGFTFPNPKYPDVSLATYGLIDSGEAALAEQFNQTQVRAVVEAQIFAEVYSVAGEVAVGVGVRPSIFGAAQIIDGIWLMNGHRYDLGLPAFVNLPHTDGGVHDLVWWKKSYDAFASASAQTVTLEGKAIKKRAECRNHVAPIGEVIVLDEHCR